MRRRWLSPSLSHRLRSPFTRRRLWPSPNRWPRLRRPPRRPRLRRLSNQNLRSCRRRRRRLSQQPNRLRRRPSHRPRHPHPRRHLPRPQQRLLRRPAASYRRHFDSASKPRHRRSRPRCRPLRSPAKRRVRCCVSPSDRNRNRQHLPPERPERNRHDLAFPEHHVRPAPEHHGRPTLGQPVHGPRWGDRARCRRHQFVRSRVSHRVRGNIRSVPANQGNAPWAAGVQDRAVRRPHNVARCRDRRLLSHSRHRRLSRGLSRWLKA